MLWMIVMVYGGGLRGIHVVSDFASQPWTLTSRSIMSTSLRHLTLVSSVLLVLCLHACASEVDETPNTFPDTQSNPIGRADGDDDANTPDGLGEVATGNTACSCLQVGDWYRFDTLLVTDLDNQPDNPAIDLLNAFWRDDLIRYELNVLFEITDVDDTTIELRAVSGARVGMDGTYCQLSNTAAPFIMNKDGCKVTSAAPGSISIFAGTSEIPKTCAPNIPVPNTIPLSNVALEVALNDTCTEVTTGLVNASIREAELAQLCACTVPPINDNNQFYAETCCPTDDPNDCVVLDPSYTGTGCAGCSRKYANLLSLVNVLQPLTYECDVDGANGACISAAFTATKIDFTPDACP